MRLNKNKFFYLHIPKTAGSSLNTFLQAQFKHEQCLTHIESQNVFQSDERIQEIDNFNLLSGHIPLPQMQYKYKVFEQRIVMATFRIPIEHVVSHISWVRKLGDSGEEKRLKQHSPEIQKLVKRLIVTDLSNPHKIKELIAWLEKENLFLFHNTQTKYLSGGNSANFEPSSIDQAIMNLKKIDFVGITERLEEYMSMLCFYLGWNFDQKETISENVNPNNYGLDIRNNEIVDSLQPLIKWDQVIYKLAREKFIDEMHLFLSLLEKQRWPRFSTVRDQLVKAQFVQDNSIKL